MATPLIRIPQPKGGTMYAFASSARDMTRAFNNPDVNFEFSHYALLDLPDFTQSTNGSNTIDFESNLLEATGSPYSASAPNVDFAQTFQNYALNAEDILLQDDDFDPVILQSDSEKLFFKWLDALGAIRFRTADSNESTEAAFTEENDSDQTGSVYNRVVKYLGTIDVENDVAFNGNTNHEVYINVPTSVGNTPTVLFQSSEYNTTSTKLYAESKIEGRAGQNHPDPNINLDSVVDEYEANTGEAYYNIDPNSTNSLQVVFDSSVYSQVTNSSEVESILDFSKRGQDFRFNAVLVYYDLYSESNPARRATNLYGILILDEIKSVGGAGSKINEQIKFKPNEVAGLNGNAFSLKLNLKFNSSLDNVGIETSVNDFTTFSMDLFMDTTSALENATELLIEANGRYTDLSNKLDNLENLVLNSENNEDLLARIKAVEDQLKNSSLQLEDSDSLLQLITKAHDRINSIIDGTIPTEVQYNTDVISAGHGIKIDKSNPRRIKVINNVNGYSLTQAYKWDSVGTPILITESSPFDISASGQGAQAFGIYAKLLKYTNRLSLQNLLTSGSGGDVRPNDDLDIYIDDGSYAWEKGQVFKISFDRIDMNGNSIEIYTGKTSGYNEVIANIQPISLISNKPYIEIVCIDPANYIFEVDILR
jgi:hypothetical protein